MPLRILNSAFIVFSIASLLGGVKSKSSIYSNSIKKNKLGQLKIVSIQCPEDHPKARELLEEFLTESDYSDKRNLSGTNGLTVDQITLLVDTNSSHQQICSELRSRPIYDPANFGDTMAVVYYKVGNFYFVSTPVIKGTTTFLGDEVIIIGDHYLSILDSNLNKLYKFRL